MNLFAIIGTSVVRATLLSATQPAGDSTHSGTYTAAVTGDRAGKDLVETAPTDEAFAKRPKGPGEDLLMPED